MDEFFRVRSELDLSFGEADAELLLPLLKPIYGDHKARLGSGPSKAGGFVDVGSNVGDVPDLLLQLFSDHPRRLYLHHLSTAQPPLVDAIHPVYDNSKLPFLLLLEASPATLQLLQRRAESSMWAISRARILQVAAANSSGSARFCAFAAGSGQSSLSAASTADAAASLNQNADGQSSCSSVQVKPLALLLDAEVGPEARIFLLKIVSAERGDGGWGLLFSDLPS